MDNTAVTILTAIIVLVFSFVFAILIRKPVAKLVRYLNTLPNRKINFLVLIMAIILIVFLAALRSP